MVQLSSRVRQIKQSAAILVDQKVRELKAAGRDVIGLGSGEPDFDTPDTIKQAAVEAIWAGRTKYTTVDGIAPLKAAIVEKFRRDSGLAFTPAQISVSAGAKQVIANAMAASLDPGDEVVIVAPYWMSYPDMVALWGGTPVFVECTQANGFKLQPAQLEAAITPRTRWLFLNSPSNPAGATYDAEELRSLGEVLLRHPHVSILSDDIYEKLVFDGQPFATIAQAVPALADRVLIVNGVSKSYCMTGWRLGYAAGPQPLIAAMAKVQGQTTTHPSSISQAAAVEALSGPQSIIATMTAAYQDRRDAVVGALNRAEGLTCLAPQGAFYVFPSCAGVIGKVAPSGRRIDSDEDLVLALLDAEGVAVVQGGAFGLSPHFRISIAAPPADLEEACTRIRRFCATLS